MNWELYRDFQNRRDISLPGGPSDRTTRLKMELILDKKLKNGTKTDTAEETRTHPRRTLDQFFYSSLSDTKKRDADQTVSKWTGAEPPEEGWEEAQSDSLMIMIDQLWCWVLDKSKFEPSMLFQNPMDYC